jgi:hypothetical protein
VEDETAWRVEQERRAVLLLARNQSERQQIVAAGRHLEELGRLIRARRPHRGDVVAGAAGSGVGRDGRSDAPPCQPGAGS